MSFSALIMVILQGVANFFKWKALDTEIRLKMLLLDTKEKYDKEGEQIQKQIDDLRLAGRNDAADLLYNQLLRRTQFLSDLPNQILEAPKGGQVSDGGGNIHPPS